MQNDTPLLAPTIALSRRLRHSATTDVTAGEQEQRRAIFIGGHGLLPEPRLLMEVLSAPRIYPVPNTPPACIGLVNLRGTLIPVFDVAPLLGVAGGRAQWILVLGTGSETAAIVIDDLPIQVGILPQEIPPEVPAALAPHLRGGARSGDRLFWELDHKSLLSALANLKKTQEEAP